jgi:hypothetical protein
LNDESIPDVPDAIAKTRSIVQRLASQQVKLRAAKLGDVVGDGADTIRDIGAELQKRRESPATQSLVDSLAKATDDVANYLRNTDGDMLFHDIQTYGRAQPAIAAAFAALAGFAAARVLKVTTIAGGRSAAS